MILLLGYGLLGRYLQQRLECEGRTYAVAGNDRMVSAGIPYRYFDYRSEEDMAGLLDGVETIVHMIHTTVPQTSYADPERDARENVDCSRRFLEYVAGQEGLQRLVYISSGGAVYGPPLQNPVTEDHPLHPISPYGRSKRRIEELVSRILGSTGIRTTILRPSNIYGHYPVVRNEFGIVAQVLRALQTGRPLKIWGSGEGRKDYLFGEDFADAVVRLLDDDTLNSEIYNLASGFGYSVLDIVRTAEACTDRHIPIVHTPARPFDVQEICIDASRFREASGWRAQYDLKAGLHQLLKSEAR